jgi:hypothetical protein
MHMHLHRGAIAVAACLAVGAASAETYVAKIYGNLGSYVDDRVAGAGDGEVMSGWVAEHSGPHLAAYRTPQGLKILHPSGFTSSEITDTYGVYHTGFANGGSGRCAFFWIGGEPGVNLHPAGAAYTQSQGNGVGGQLQVGQVTMNTPCEVCGSTAGTHAARWGRTAASFVRLHMNGLSNTIASGTDGVSVVGKAGDTLFEHAVLWPNGTSAGVSLHPVTYDASGANSVDGNVQGGWGRISGWTRAMLWKGTAASAVNLTPPDFEWAVVDCVRGNLQVGTGFAFTTPDRAQAIAWHGTANSWINLHFMLPYPFTFWHSYASDIDANGNITGYVQSPDFAISRPVVWVRQG